MLDVIKEMQITLCRTGEKTFQMEPLKHKRTLNKTKFIAISAPDIAAKEKLN
jgi:hypothetical protein